MDIIITIDTHGKETIYFNKDDTKAIELVYELTEVQNNEPREY